MQKSLSILLLTALGMAACNQNKVSVSENGVKYQLHDEHKDARKPKEGELMTFSLVIKNSQDSVLRNSNTDGQPVNMLVQPGSYKGSFEDGIRMLSVGDSATFYVSVDSLFSRSPQPPPPFLKPGTDMKFSVRLLKVENQQEYEKRMEAERKTRPQQEEAAIKAYMNKAGLKNTQRLPSGVHYAVTQAGSGPAVAAGDSITVLYVAKLISGQVFDQNQEQGLPFRVGMKQMIPGFDEAVLKLRQGDRAVIVMPSSAAYGEQGSPPVIPPNAILIFETELKSVRKQ